MDNLYVIVYWNTGGLPRIDMCTGTEKLIENLVEATEGHIKVYEIHYNETYGIRWEQVYPKEVT